MFLHRPICRHFRNFQSQKHLIIKCRNHSSGTPSRVNTRSGRLQRVLLYTAAVGTVTYAIDKYIVASSVSRTLRSFSTGLTIALDYKLNFRPHPIFGGSIHDVHLRNAQRIFDLLQTNGGLYLKIGQALAMNSAVLPREFQAMFERMFDDAPQNDWDDVRAVIEEDFGQSVENLFKLQEKITGDSSTGVMEQTARASASVAQVHWARLRDGREVAIKVQKREIARQLTFDIWTFRTLTWLFSKSFDVPFDTLIPFVSERLELETDFLNEAKNAETMRGLIETEPCLRGKVYIPVVYPEFCSRRVLTTEWIEGVQLWDRKGLTNSWKGLFREGSPGTSHPLSSVQLDSDQMKHEALSPVKIKPTRDAYKGLDRDGGLGVSPKSVMTIMVDLFAAQIFKWGVVHCDPHPGNVLVRRLPGGKPQMVLLDHGLYVTLPDKLRKEYAEFWKALLTFDMVTIGRITKEWGIGTSEELASMTLMKPFKGTKTKAFLAQLEGKSPEERQYLIQQRMKSTMRDFLEDEKKIPQEFVFLGRNMRIVQGNNQFFGSPVNRVKMMGEWASRSLYQDHDLPFTKQLEFAGRHIIFKAVLYVSDILFYFYRIRQYFGSGKSFEDKMEDRLKDLANDYGMDFSPDILNG